MAGGGRFQANRSVTKRSSAENHDEEYLARQSGGGGEGLTFKSQLTGTYKYSIVFLPKAVFLYLAGRNREIYIYITCPKDNEIANKMNNKMKRDQYIKVVLSLGLVSWEVFCPKHLFGCYCHPNYACYLVRFIMPANLSYREF